MKHARPSRFLAVALAVPVLAAGAPLLGQASAAVSISASEVQFSPRIVGPNAGFQAPALGFNGHSAIFRFTTNDAAAVVEEVRIDINIDPPNVPGPVVNVFRDFNPGDGFGIFPDLDNDAVFDANEYDSARRSTGWAAGNQVGTTTPISIAGRTSGDEPRATGANAYFVTVHPAPNVRLVNRAFQPTVVVNGVTVVGGQTGPASALTAQPITIDSVAPPQPAVAAFGGQSKAAGTEDAFTVTAHEYFSEPGKNLAFFNSPTDASPGGLLKRLDGAVAAYPAPSAGGTLAIGDGTGITANVSVAKNNQKSDTLYVRAYDAAGNLSAATSLGNDVTSPAYDSAEVDLASCIIPDCGDATTESGPLTSPEDGINIDLEDDAPVYVGAVELGPSPLPGIAPRDTVKVQARVAAIGVDGQPGAATTWAVANPAYVEPTGVDSDAYTVFAIDTRETVNGQLVIPDGAEVVAQARFTDLLDNGTDILSSRRFPKDVTAPQLIAVSPLQGTLTDGDKLAVLFNEPIDEGTIAESTAGQDPCDTSPPTPFSAGTCVNRMLNPSFTTRAPDPSAGELWDVNPDSDGVTYGALPGWSWSSDSTTGTITLDAVAPGGVVPLRLARLGDFVRTDLLDAGEITDLLGNALGDDVVPITSDVLPSGAKTLDVLSTTQTFSQPGDGKLDGIDITFSTNLADPDAAFLNNVRIVHGGVTVAPTAATVTNNVLRLTFDSTFGTGTRPQVVVTVGSGGTTGLFSTADVAVGAFRLTAADGVAPRAIAAETRDADLDGHIDQVVVTYSETINRASESADVQGYRVFDYETQPEGVVLPIGVTVVNPSNSFAALGAAQTVLDLAEHTGYDSDAQPRLKYTKGFPPNAVAEDPTLIQGICDSAGPQNCNLGFDVPLVTDRAVPIIVSRFTRDFTSDGRLDAVSVVFSEFVSPTSVPRGGFNVEGHAVSAVSALGSGKEALVAIDELPAAGSGDTDALPKVQYTGGADGGIVDSTSETPNSAPADAGLVVPTDGAGPAIVAASLNFTPPNPGDGSKMRVLLSEALYASTVQASDFVVRQADTTATVGSATVLTGNAKAYDLTLTPTLDPMKDATVAFTAPGVVEDNTATAGTPPAIPATAGVRNTQASPVTAFAFPTAQLDVTGPDGSADGYSTSRTFFTGAAGNGSVTAWLLQVVPGGTAVTPPSSADDARFSTARTDMTTVPNDGVYDIYLWTRDGFGNVAHTAPVDHDANPGTPPQQVPAEVKGFVVDTSPPQVTSVAFQNLDRSGTLVRDNDRFRVVGVATTTGADVTSLTGAANVFDLTGVVAHKALAPFSTSTNTTTRTRTFTFPYVRAGGSTIYPVGTVLKVIGDSGAPFIIDDAASGNGIVKRRYLSNQALATYQIPSSHVINVPATVLASVPAGPTKLYRDGSLVRAIGTSQVFLISDAKKRPITSAAAFYGLGFSFANVVSVPAADLNQVPAGTNVTPGVHASGVYVRRTSDGTTYAVVTGSDGVARKRRITSYYALKLLVRPAEVVAVNASHPTLALSDDGVRGVRDGMLVRTGSASIYVISRGQRRHITSATLLALSGWNPANIASVPIHWLGIASIGTPYSLRSASYSVTVRDTAGNTSTKTGTVTALGTLGVKPTTAMKAPLP